MSAACQLHVSSLPVHAWFQWSVQLQVQHNTPDATITKQEARANKQDALLKEFGLVTANAVAEYHVLNELIVDRGPSPFLTQLDVWIDDEYVTCVQGDGLIVATPTGSTAYSAAAGGSMVHPSVPCVLLTPVCPHNVTSRPIVVPAGARIKLTVPKDARSEAFAAFDGRNRQRLRRGESILITSSRWPVRGGRLDEGEGTILSLMRCAGALHHAVAQRVVSRTAQLSGLESKGF